MIVPTRAFVEMTRRAFLSGLAAGAGGLLRRPQADGAWAYDKRPDIVLSISNVRVDVAPGHVVKTTAYNASVPGPVIRLREGTSVSVEIFNETDTPEYVHWHGLPLPAEIDGAGEEKSLVVPPRGYLRYHMTPEAPGSRYVHSHAMAMNDLSRGVYSGQFGFVYVESNSNTGRYDREVFLATHEWDPFFIEGDEDAAPGTLERFGETDWGSSMVEVGYKIRSINGKALGHGEPIRVREGERVLFHLLNANGTENIELSLPGHEFIVIALDGNEVPNPQRIGVLELGVGERVDAIVEMKNPGVWILGSADEDVRGSGLGIIVEYAGRKGLASISKTTGAGWDYAIFGENQGVPAPDETVPMVIERARPDENGFERWTVNGESFDQKKEPRILEKGRRYRLVLDNRSGDAHPLHLHRNTFELTSIDGRPTSGIKKDVVLVKPHQTVAVDFTPAREGLTLFHCHNQLHMDFGFKTLFNVV